MLMEGIKVKPSEGLNYKSWCKNVEVRKSAAERQLTTLGNRLDLDQEESSHKIGQVFLEFVSLKFLIMTNQYKGF